MSGAAGLAAAKRRRATAPVAKTKPARTSLQSAPSSTPPPPPPAPVTTSENKMTPLQSLNQHEIRIKELEGESIKLDSLDKEINELKQTILKMQTFAIEQSLELTKLKKSLETTTPSLET